MKTRILISIMLGLITLAFVFKETRKTESPVIPPTPQSSQFLIGAMSNGDERDYNNAQNLNINLWHKYTGVSVDPVAGWPNVTNDSVWENPDYYADEIRWRVNRNQQHGLYTFYDRPKWVYLAYGQRSDYQADVDSAQEWDKLWWYSFKTRSGNREADNEFNGGQYVLHVSSSESSPGAKYVLKNLYANREQSYGFWATDTSDLPDWYVKPRIRVKPYDVQNYPNKRVCRLEVLRWDSSIVDSVTIFAKSFAQWTSPELYDGRYIEKYYYSYPGDSDYVRILPGNTFLSPYGRDSTYIWQLPCGIDYRIYWYDEVECWIDYIRVDNWIAHNLYGSGYYHDLFESWIQKEMQIATSYPDYVHNCYIEEWEYNIIPCVSYVNNRIKYWSNYYGVNNPPISLTINFNEGVPRQPIPHGNYNRHFTPEFVKRFVIDSAGLDKELVITNYPLTGRNDQWSPPTHIPNTLPVCNTIGCSYSEDNAILGVPLSPKDYDSWLQNYFDYYYDTYLDFIGLMKQGKEAARLAGIRFMPMLQTHLWHWDPGQYAYKLREPTNEELKMMGNIAVSYGAKGILWFWFATSFGND